MPWMAWSPKGDRLAYFVRTEKERTLIIQNVLTRKIEQRIPMKSVDEPESPSFSPDGRTDRVLGAARRHRRHLHGRPRDQPDRQPDDRRFLRLRRRSTRPTASISSTSRAISGNQKLFRLDLDTKKKTQLTFGTVRRDARRSSSTTIRSSSRRPRPIRVAARARDGEERQHLQHLDARSRATAS